jgi:hypothetical protein
MAHSISSRCRARLRGRRCGRASRALAANPDVGDGVELRTAVREPTRAGSVLGMQATLVTPPATADAVPVARVSSSSRPGSRKCTCMSMSPGQTILPPASMVWVGCRFGCGPRPTMCSPRIQTSVTASSFCEGSMTRPFVIRRVVMKVIVARATRERTCTGSSSFRRRIGQGQGDFRRRREAGMPSSARHASRTRPAHRNAAVAWRLVALSPG